jgi:hypothetical protein
MLARKRAAAAKARSEKARVTHAAKIAAKATYAPEPPHEGRPSRKSTRKSAHRVKPDSSFSLRESLQKGSPESRARRARAKSVRARGSKR